MNFMYGERERKTTGHGEAHCQWICKEVIRLLRLLSIHKLHVYISLLWIVIYGIIVLCIVNLGKIMQSMIYFSIYRIKKWSE